MRAPITLFYKVIGALISSPSILVHLFDGVMPGAVLAISNILPNHFPVRQKVSEKATKRRRKGRKQKAKV